MAEVDFIGKVHKSTKRDYVQRVVEFDKAECAEVACRFDKDYWDGDRQYGFGGYNYDGRWRAVADDMIGHYGLTTDAKILDVGCGKAFLLHDFTEALPGIEAHGIDISEYAIKNAMESVRTNLKVCSAAKLPYPDNHFDFVYSINTLHNLLNFELLDALKEMQRVGKQHRFICVEAYRNEREKANLMYWQLTCRAFHKPEEWLWLYEWAGYEGDHGFIYFE